MQQSEVETETRATSTTKAKERTTTDRDSIPGAILRVFLPSASVRLAAFLRDAPRLSLRLPPPDVSRLALAQGREVAPLAALLLLLPLPRDCRRTDDESGGNGFSTEQRGLHSRARFPPRW